MGIDRDTLIYPDVIASTKPGDVEVESTGHYFAEAVTNNHDTVVRTAIYWYMPQEEEGYLTFTQWSMKNSGTLADYQALFPDTGPVLMIEIDDEDQGGPDPMDINIRIRRNDGLIYEGTRADQESLEES